MVGKPYLTILGSSPEYLSSIPLRFWPKVDKTEFCWNWKGSKDGNGYGQIRIGPGHRGRLQKAYRVAFELTKGAIPESLTLDHLCRNHACVNPDHMEPVAFRENVLRGMSPLAINARKISCPKGHPLSGTNLAVEKGGARKCKICKLATRRLWYQRHKDEFNQKRRDRRARGLKSW